MKTKIAVIMGLVGLGLGQALMAQTQGTVVATNNGGQISTTITNSPGTCDTNWVVDFYITGTARGQVEVGFGNPPLGGAIDPPPGTGCNDYWTYRIPATGYIRVVPYGYVCCEDALLIFYPLSFRPVVGGGSWKTFELFDLNQTLNSTSCCGGDTICEGILTALLLRPQLPGCP